MSRICVLQAGMIRMGREEFFIEPLVQHLGGGGGAQKEAEQGRKHVVYRSSAIIKKTPVTNQSTDDFIPGEKSDMHGKHLAVINRKRHRNNRKRQNHLVKTVCLSSNSINRINQNHVLLWSVCRSSFGFPEFYKEICIFSSTTATLYWRGWNV